MTVVMRSALSLLKVIALAWIGMAGMNASHADDAVTIQLRWHHQFQFAGYYAALEQGYYREEGIDVRLVPGSPERQPVDEVLSGRAQYAEGNSEVLLHRLQGKPLVALAAIFQHSPSVLITLKASGIDSVHELAGNKVMLMSKSEDADFLTMFLSEGIALNQLDILPSSFNLDDLLQGRVQAFNAYLTNEPFLLQKRGIGYNVIAPSNYRIDFYSDILFTSEAELRNHPERVEAMRRATLRGWRYAMDHPDEIIDLLINKYQVRKTREHLQFEAREMRTLIFPDLIEIGHMNPWRWKHMADTFVSAGLAEPDYSLEGFIYDPKPRNMPAWVMPVFAVALTLLALALALAYYFHRLNRRLASMQKKLAKSESMLNEAQQIAHLGSWDWNIAENSVQWSDEAAGIYVPDNPTAPASFEAFKASLHPDDAEQVLAALKSTLGHDAPYDLEHRVLSSSKGVRYVHAQGKVFRDPAGKAVRLVGTVQDITHAKLLELELTRQAHVDFLTGLSNRRYFMDLSDHELSRAVRYRTPLSLFMLDIDYFKQVNDTHGHKAGDSVLKKLAEICRQTLREMDIIGRVGGEEFAILLPETDLTEAVEVAERLREKVAAARVPQEGGGLPLRFTVSIGVASLSSTEDNLDVLLSAADQALYQAKNGGRNRVCAAAAG